MRKTAIFLGLWLLPILGNFTSQFQVKDPIATENDAIVLAALDLKTLDPVTASYTRYIWITNGVYEDAQITSLTVNYISRTGKIYPLKLLGKGGLMLARVDLRLYAVGDDRVSLVKTWEEFRYDPALNFNITKDTLAFAEKLGIDLPVHKHQVKRSFKDKQQYSDKKTGKLLGYWDETTQKYYSQPWIEEYVSGKGVADEEVVRVRDPTLNLEALNYLYLTTGSQTPVVSHEYFIFRALSAIQEKEDGRDTVYSVIYGGLYYDLSGIRRVNKKGTDEENLLARLGLGNVEAGVKAADIFNKLPSDRRVAVFQSLVTGRPRRIDFQRTLAGGVGDNQSIIIITQDLAAKNIDIGTHFMLNLLELAKGNKVAAKEVIWELPNGLHGFALFDGNGKLLDEAGPDVVADTTIPSPYGTRLQPAISCIRCHAPDSGWRHVENDVTKLTGPDGVDIFGDNDPKGKKQGDVVTRLVDLYGGDMEKKLLPRARIDYNNAILLATDVWKASKMAQVDIAPLTGQYLAKMYADYWYTKVGAERALTDLAIEVKDPKLAHKQLAKLLPPMGLLQDNGETRFIMEDGRVGALKVGIPIIRSDYDLVRPLLRLRVRGLKK